MAKLAEVRTPGAQLFAYSLVIVSDPANDHEHCADMGQCWMDPRRGPCPELDA